MVAAAVMGVSASTVNEKLNGCLSDVIKGQQRGHFSDLFRKRHQGHSAKLNNNLTLKPTAFYLIYLVLFICCADITKFSVIKKMKICQKHDYLFMDNFQHLRDGHMKPNAPRTKSEHQTALTPFFRVTFCSPGNSCRLKETVLIFITPVPSERMSVTLKAHDS